MTWQVSHPVSLINSFFSVCVSGWVFSLCACVCVCDLSSVWCLHDVIASTHQTFPSILLRTLSSLYYPSAHTLQSHRKCNSKKLAFIPLNWLMFSLSLPRTKFWFWSNFDSCCWIETHRYVLKMWYDSERKKNVQIFQWHAHCSYTWMLQHEHVQVHRLKQFLLHNFNLLMSTLKCRSRFHTRIVSATSLTAAEQTRL